MELKLCRAKLHMKPAGPCMECQRLWRDRNKDRLNDINRKWAEKHRAELAEYASEYYKNNKEKALEWAREYYRKNREKILARISSYQKQNPDKMARLKARRTSAKRKAHGSFTVDEWQAICDRQRGKCAMCGKKRKLTVDHIVPLSKGGCNFAFNIQGLCGPCNTVKNARLDGIVTVSLFDRVRED